MTAFTFDVPLSFECKIFVAQRQTIFLFNVAILLNTQ